jgi:HAD superfamily hydrolase (TIGR01509 family)
MFKKYFKNKKAVFFDLDGTIIDSLPYWKQAFLALFSERGFPQTDLKDILHGHYVADIWRKLIKEGHVDTALPIEELVSETYKQYLKIFRDNPLEPRDGFWSFLDEIKNDKKWQIGLLSNSNRQVVDPVMNMLDLGGDLFDIVITGDEVKHRKPSPDIYKKALKSLSLKANDVLVFEDSVTGSQAAEAAGLEVIAIWSGDISEAEYPKNVLTFMPDFDALSGNLDTTYMEHTNKSMEQLKSEFS